MKNVHLSLALFILSAIQCTHSMDKNSPRQMRKKGTHRPRNPMPKGSGMLMLPILFGGPISSTSPQRRSRALDIPVGFGGPIK